jgi:hypothetical protein
MQGEQGMSRFLTELNAPLKDDSDTVYVLKAPLVYQSELAGIIVVPSGFETDLASVPRVPFAYMAFGGRAHREAVLHDYLYRIGCRPRVSFMTANRTFLEAMKVRGKSGWIRWSMFCGVCLGGYFSFRKKYVTDKF